jgi:microcystin-dependent protein
LKTIFNRTLYTIILALTLQGIIAQSPQLLSYQAIVRDAGNKLVTNQNVGMKISILQGSPTGTAVYTETQPATTNANGLVTISIGNGNAVTGTFTVINWANGPYFLETETDPAGGTNYTITGTSQILSVPYALYAKTSHTSDSINYNSLTGLPTLFNGQYNSLTGTPDLATVATSGSYDDLTGKPNIPSSQVNSDWNSTSGVSMILNKPSGTKAQSPLTINNDSVEISKAGVIQGNMITYNGNNWEALDLDTYHPVIDETDSTNAPIMQPYLVLNYCIALGGIYPLQNGGNETGEGAFTGEIKLFAFNFAPVGWAFCNGQLLPISGYPDLFNLIGTTFGGDGVKTFALPNLQGRIPLDLGQGTGLTQRPFGVSGGSESTTIHYNDKYRK